MTGKLLDYMMTPVEEVFVTEWAAQKGNAP